MRRCKAFTLIELLVVLAIVALMLTIAAPRYVDHVERARETALRATLKELRNAIDKFEGDVGRLPLDLDELVARRYLRELPIDPVTDRRDTWIVFSEAEIADALATRAATMPSAPQPAAPGVADVRSGAVGNGRDGTAFNDW